jgi:Putative bacterial sensory transduction regulator
VQFTIQALEDFLTGDGWPFERLDESTWKSGFSADGRHFRFFVRLTQNWLCLTIVPFVATTGEGLAVLPLYKRLLDLNREVNLAKFAVDKGDVILTVELPRENLAGSQLKDGLDALVFYANMHHRELAALAPQA